jgi:hypothetical protein
MTVSGPNLLSSLEIAPTAFVSPLFIERKVLAHLQTVTSAAERTRATGFLVENACEAFNKRSRYLVSAAVRIRLDHNSIDDRNKVAPRFAFGQIDGTSIVGLAIFR